MTHHTAEHVLAEVAVEATAEGDAHGQLVNRSIEALEGPEVIVKVGPLSTTLEGALDDVLHAVVRAHKVIAYSADRVVTSVRIESKQAGLRLDEREAKAAGTRGAL